MLRLHHALLLVLPAVCCLPAKLHAELELGKTYTVLTTEGKVHTGTLIEETKTKIVLRVAGEKDVTIPRGNIEAIREKKESLSQAGMTQLHGKWRLDFDSTLSYWSRKAAGFRDRSS